MSVMAVDPLPVDRLFRPCDPASLGFATTAELEPIEGIVGQDRAVEAVEFAIRLTHQGYNLFALGPEGVGRSALVRGALERHAASQPVPDDWAYVHNFAEPQRPRALRLPAGRGVRLRTAMERLVAELRSALPAAFESDAYRARREALEEELRRRRDRALAEFEKRARELDVALLRTPMGLGLAMVRGDEVITPEQFRQLPPEEQERRRQNLSRLEAELQMLLRHIPSWEREGRQQLQALNREVIRSTASPLIEAVRAAFADLPAVLDYLSQVEADVIAHAEDFLAAATATDTTAPPAIRALAAEEVASLRRYTVNLIVDHDGRTGAPVVYEDNPTFANLVGRIEHISQLGALVTNFTLIKPGALHRANGGYLILDARKVLLEPYAWEGLKRALRAQELRIESLGQALALVSTVSLEPEPIPLSVKVALIGDRLLYYLLAARDPDFLELFKVPADFSEDVDRSPETDRIYARLIAGLARRAGLRAFDAGGVARVIEAAARDAGDAEKVSTHMRSLNDLLVEADYFADQAGRQVVTAADVQAAIDAKIRRVGRLRERLGEQFRRGILLVDTVGAAVGQVNGLSVYELGEDAFGWPTRITARVRLGSGEVVDIEREVDLGGPIHSKGVMILAGFLGGRYAADKPLSLRASLVFEQSYGGVEGDSASLAELCALISAIADVPLRQGIALTGSVNQHGAVQAIGGVNEKIEGFFDVCAARGLTGDQGVVIPAANVSHLMLRADVVAAAAEGRFHIWPVTTVDEALELLTGLPAGERGPDGRWPEGTVNALVDARLETFARTAREYGRGEEEAGPAEAEEAEGEAEEEAPEEGGPPPEPGQPPPEPGGPPEPPAPGGPPPERPEPSADRGEPEGSGPPGEPEPSEPPAPSEPDRPADAPR